MWISPHYQDTDFKKPMSLDDKITVFEDRTLGWKLGIADQIMNGKKTTDGKWEQPPVQHAGFASLDIVMSYFEMIAKYEDGFADKGKSKEYFKSGVYLVFPELRLVLMPQNIPGVEGQVETLADIILDLMYDGIRCGLYHRGLTNGQIMLTGEIDKPLALDIQNQMLIVNPHLLAPKLIAHLLAYAERLKNTSNTDLRTKFERCFNFDNGA